MRKLAPELSDYYRLTTYEIPAVLREFMMQGYPVIAGMATHNPLRPHIHLNEEKRTPPGLSVLHDKDGVRNQVIFARFLPVNKISCFPGGNAPAFPHPVFYKHFYHCQMRAPLYRNFSRNQNVDNPKPVIHVRRPRRLHSAKRLHDIHRRRFTLSRNTNEAKPADKPPALQTAQNLCGMIERKTGNPPKLRNRQKPLFVDKVEPRQRTFGERASRRPCVAAAAASAAPGFPSIPPRLTSVVFDLSL
jgi:hypothetical protein